MKNNLTFDHYIKLNIDYSKIVNSTLDIEKDSILCIDLNNIEKLDTLILEGLKKAYLRKYYICWKIIMK